MIKNKTGSHVGIILSFVIFILFVVFLYVVFEPFIKIQQDKELALEYLEKELIESSTAELTTVAISFIQNYPLAEVSCVEILHPENFGDLNYAVVKKDGDLIGSSKLTNSIQFDISENLAFFKIYYSDEAITGSPLTDIDCELAVKDTNYKIGHIQTKEYIFESKILGLIGDENAQEEIRNLINSEFDFGFTDAEGAGKTIVFSTTEDVSTNIYVKEIPIQYIDEQANIKSGYLNIRIW